MNQKVKSKQARGAACTLALLLVACGGRTEDSSEDSGLTETDMRDTHDDGAERAVDSVSDLGEAGDSGLVGDVDDADDGTTDSEVMLKAEALASAQPVPAAVAVFGESVFWAALGEGGTIRRRSLSGVGGIEIMASAQNSPRRLFVDSDWIYWLDGSGGRIARRPVLAGSTADIVSGLLQPAALAVGPFGYVWTERTSTTDLTYALSSLSTSGTRSTVYAGLSEASDVVVYKSQVFLATTDALVLGSLDGAPLAAVKTGSTPHALAMAGDDLLWTAYAGGLFRTNSSSLATESLADGVSAGALAVGGGYVYWVRTGVVSSPSGSLGRVHLKTKKAETLLTGLAYPRGVAADGLRVYWTTSDGGVWMAFH